MNKLMLEHGAHRSPQLMEEQHKHEMPNFFKRWVLNLSPIRSVDEYTLSSTSTFFGAVNGYEEHKLNVNL